LLHAVADNLLVLLILVVLGLLVSIKQWPEWTRRVRSANWPTTQGTIESGEVKTDRTTTGRSFRSVEIATVTLGYSYRLNASYYSGYHIETFLDEQKAWFYVDGLKGREVQISYNPRKPEVSVLPRAILARLAQSS
jgi:hypothetical protein